MKQIRTSLTVVAVAGAGIAGSLVVGRLTGMDGGDLARLAVAMLPSVAGTVVAVAIARPLLAKASIAWRMVSIATVAAAISLANLIVASRLMFLSGHAAKVLGILVAYSVAAGAGTALALARSSRAGIERLMATARRFGGGDLSARVGRLDAEPELRTLAATLDDMAEQISRSIEHERFVETMRRDLFNAISHDLRTPLSRLKVVAAALEEGVIDDPDEVRRYVGEMHVAVDALIKLVDDLFELVHAEPDQVAAEPRARFRSVVGAALEPCVAIAREKGVSVRTDLDGAADALCSPRLERVLQTLLVNAVRHTDEGEILVRGRMDGSDLVVEVSDTGQGIEERNLPLVFEPFWRGDAARSSPGSGLGLTLARRVVEHLGGAISATSRVGHGSLFTVTVPMEEAG